MNSHRRVSFTILVVLGLAAPARAAEAWQFQRDVVCSVSEETLIAVPLDADIYAATRIDFPDIRLQSARGASVPFLIRKPQDVQPQIVRERSWTARNPQLRPLEAGGLEITLTLDADDPVPDGLTLVTPLRDFEQRVRLETSSNGLDWQPAGAEHLLFDYARFMEVRQVEIPFPDTRDRQIRLLIDSVTAEQESELLELTRNLRGTDETNRSETALIRRRPFRIERIEFWTETTRDGRATDRMTNVPITGFTVETDPDQHRTIVKIQARREPRTSFTLLTSSRNFSRTASLEVPDPDRGPDQWKPLGQATLSRIQFQSFQREHLTVTIPESRSDLYRLVIEDRDSPPLTLTGVDSRGPTYELITLIPPGEQYQLLYGNPEIAAPQHDTAPLRVLLAEHYRPEPALLGTATRRDAVRARTWQHIATHPAVLTGIIAVLVLVLGYCLYLAAQRVDAVAPPDTPDP